MDLTKAGEEEGSSQSNQSLNGAGSLQSGGLSAPLPSLCPKTDAF